jgi:hypothetical protein
MKTYLPEMKRGQLVVAAQPGPRTIPPVVHKYQWPFFGAALFLVDSGLILLAFRLAYFLRFDLELSIFRQDAIVRQPFYQVLYGVLFVLWLGLFAGLGLYNRQNLLGGTD